MVSLITQQKQKNLTAIIKKIFRKKSGSLKKPKAIAGIAVSSVRNCGYHYSIIAARWHYPSSVSLRLTPSPKVGRLLYIRSYCQTSHIQREIAGADIGSVLPFPLGEIRDFNGD
jgi:hypothetical protein